MDSASVKKTRDMISNLPDNLIETILLKLPLRDAARTCILSSRWRHSWVKLPHLILDSAFWKQSIKEDECQTGGKLEVSNIISQIFFLHQGSITYFKLEIPKYRAFPAIDSLIKFIVGNGVQTFDLITVPDEDYKLPTSIFNCPTLNTLNLWYCKINFLPSPFRRLRLLVSLTLVDVVISAEALQTLLSSCRLLEILQLRMSIDIRYLKFNFPKLNRFLYYYSSSYTQSTLNNLLKQAILKLFDGVPCIRSLIFDGRCLKSLVEGGGVPMILPSPLLHVVSIELHSIALKEEDQLSCAQCLIKSSPNLQTLKIVVVQTGNDSSHHFEEANSWMTCNHLREVTVEAIVGGRAEMKLIEILFAKSPSLRKMSIQLATHKDEEKVKILKELFLFKHAASNVTVNIID